MNQFKSMARDCSCFLVPGGGRHNKSVTKSKKIKSFVKAVKEGGQIIQLLYKNCFKVCI